ncbi:overexpressed in colon carcinoma 1 protein isoform X2 [Pyxicephalus adspersus]|uniref:overexpressed in colon carcinoma 1 protein isoform X2 n=1 Tax=Pyxicephalus adspersus TaxID=30357 RepID=UPI003B5BD070
MHSTTPLSTLADILPAWGAAIRHLREVVEDLPVMHDTTSHEEKHRNYGGVYVGLPTDPSTCGSPSEAQAPSPPYTRSTKPDSSLAEDAC